MVAGHPDNGQKVEIIREFTQSWPPRGGESGEECRALRRYGLVTTGMVKSRISREAFVMTYHGHIKNGVAVLDETVRLAEGTPVRIEVLDLDADFWKGKSMERLDVCGSGDCELPSCKILTSPFASIGAAEERVQALMAELGHSLPDDYLHFMRQTNGYTGDVGDSGYVSIWPIEDVVPTNRANNYREWIPGLVLFASDESGDFYAFDMRHSRSSVVFIPSIPLDLEYAREVGVSFIDFLERLARHP